MTDNLRSHCRRLEGAVLLTECINLVLHFSELGLLLSVNDGLSAFLDSVMQVASLLLSSISERGSCTLLTISYIVDGILQGSSLLADSQAVLAAAVSNLLSNLHITLLQSVDSLHTAHTYLITYTLDLRGQGRNSTLNLAFGAVQLSGKITERIAVATDGIHQETTAIVIVNLVSNTTTTVIAETTPAITSPTHEEEKEYYPHKPAAFAAHSVVALHGKKDIWVNTLLLEQRCKKTKHSIVRC